MSAATIFYATFQPLTMSLGICIAATILELGTLFKCREHPTLPTFSIAFLVVATISGAAVIWNRRFASDTGAEMSGHRPVDRKGK